MREIRTLRSMSGERKRSDGPTRTQATAPLLDSTKAFDGDLCMLHLLAASWVRRVDCCCVNYRREQFAENGALDKSRALLIFFENECFGSLFVGRL